MSQDIEPISAFAAYTAKRKSKEQLPHTIRKRTKNKHLSQEVAASEQNCKSKKVAQQTIKEKQIKETRTSNVNAKTRIGVIKRSGLKKIMNLKKASKWKNLKNKAKAIRKKQANYNILNKQNDCQIQDGFDDPEQNCVTSFKWLIYPIKVTDFLKEYWEKHPVHIKRNESSYYKSLASTLLLDKVLREYNILFTKNIDITSYTDGVRETHNPHGRAVPSVIWDYYANGCSVRMLNPQTFLSNLYTLGATLQEFFNCFVGSNLYLTPPNSQGFAPHYDDIEAFVLQVEGKKRWRLYKPPENGYLARYSSKNFDQSEIGEPIMDTIVTAGDLLYFPRGTIHQAETIDNTHSLHITLSVFQKNSYCDFFEKLLPQALKRAAETDSEYRRGLPVSYLKYFGAVMQTADDDAERETFKARILHLFARLADHMDIDGAADLMAKSHIHDFLPPALTSHEQRHSVVRDGENMSSNGVVSNRVGIECDTKIRLLRMHCMRLIMEDDTYRIYFSTENSKEYHEYDPQFLEIDEEFVPAIRKIIISYPKFIRVGDLPINDDDTKIQIVRDLWEKNLVVTYNLLRSAASTRKKKAKPVHIKKSLKH